MIRLYSDPEQPGFWLAWDSNGDWWEVPHQEGGWRFKRRSDQASQFHRCLPLPATQAVLTMLGVWE